MGTAKPKPGVRLEDLFFYFDGVERDRLETSGISRKAGEVLALRDRLVQLPDEQFDAAIKALRSLVASGGADGGEATGGAARRPAARDLYDRTRQAAAGATGTTGKVSPT